MRTRTRGKKALLVATVAMALAPSVSSMAARSPGTISLLDPVTSTAYSDHVPFAWTFRPGAKVKTTSQIYFQATTDQYRWRTLSSKVPINSGAYLWDTAAWPEGTYWVRSVVHSTLIASSVGPIIVDRTAPLSQITRPSEGDVIVEDLAEAYGAVVVGTTMLEADTFDGGSGVEDVTWLLDDEAIGSGTPFEYNFSMQPGPHILKVEVTDFAGNASSHEVQLIAGPGPSIVAGDLPDPTDGLPIPDPTLPDGVPTLPDGVPAPPEGVPAPPEGLPEDVPPGGVPNEPPATPEPPTGPPTGIPPELPTVPAP